VVRTVAIVTRHACRRKRRGLRFGKEDEVTYQVWLVLVVCPERADTASEAAVNHCLDLGPAHKADEPLKETVAEVLAGRLEGIVWKTTDDLSEGQVAGLLAGLPDMMKTLAEKPLDILGDAAGLPAPAVSFGADVAVTVVLKPVLEPLQSTVHVLEVVGIVLGLVTGMHPLVITCVKHLAYDELGDALTRAFEQILSPTGAQALDTQPPALRPGMELSFTAESAIASARSRNRTAAFDPQSARRPSIPTVTGTLHREISGTVNSEAAVKGSIEQAVALRAALKRCGIEATACQDDTGAPATGLLTVRAASAIDSINGVSSPYTAS